MSAPVAELVDAADSKSVGLALEVSANECTDDYWKRREIFSELLAKCEVLAQSGNAEAQETLGMLYEEGSSSNFPNYTEAAKWFRKAAEQGHPGAQWWLGTLLVRGEGVLQDFREAREWFQQAADQGESLAKWDLGKVYRDGLGVQRDYVQAHMWLNLVAADGYRVAARERDELQKLMTREQIVQAQKMAREWREKHPHVIE